MRYALVFFAVLTLAQSQPPSPTPPKVSQANQQQTESKRTKTETNQQTAAPSPVTLYQNFAPITDGKQQQPSNPSKNESPKEGPVTTVSNIVLAFATAAIAVLAFFQWQTLKEHKTAFETLAKHMGDGLTETKKAADAATKSAAVAERSLQVSQRAIVGIDSIKLKFEGGERHGPPINSLVISYVELVVKNSGPTIATRCYFEFRISIDGSSENPAPVVTHPTSVNPSQTIGEVSNTLGKLFPHNSEIAGGFMRGEIRVNGFVRYKDIFGNGTYVEFSSSLDPKNGEFRITQDVRPDGEQPPKN